MSTRFQSHFLAQASKYALAIAATLLLLGSCKGGSSASDAGIDATSVVVDADLSPDANLLASDGDGVDILFVVDNSGTMTEEQASLVANFNRFVNVLENIEGGLPDIHIAVISADLGAGPFGIQGCQGDGDGGRMQNAPVGGACDSPVGRFIRDEIAADGVTRIKNYSGSLADTFSCIAELGTTGCGFEQPLEAMRRALNGSNPENAGFLRDDAFLAVVIISDEDDCSTEDVSLFDSDPELDVIDSTIGPLTSFRCFEFGVVCQPDTPRSAGPRTSCVPRTDSQFMYDVSSYVDFLKGLKSDPGLVLVAGIIGNPTPVVVGSEDGEPTLDPSCMSAAGEADPGVRLQAFLDGFPSRSTSTTICDDDLSSALVLIADLLAGAIVSP